MLFYNEFLNNTYLISIAPIISYLMLALGFFLYLPGLLSRAIKEANIEMEGLEPIKWLRFLEQIGTLIIISGISLLTYSFIHLIPALFIHIYFSGMILGISLLIIHEIMDKNTFSTILLFIALSIIILEFNWGITPIFDASFFTPFNEIYAHPIQIFDTIQRVAIIIFFITACAFLFIKGELKEDSKTKDILKDVIIVAFFVWIVAISQMIIFSVI